MRRSLPSIRFDTWSGTPRVVLREPAKQQPQSYFHSSHLIRSSHRFAQRPFLIASESNSLLNVAMNIAVLFSPFTTRAYRGIAFDSAH